MILPKVRTKFNRNNLCAGGYSYAIFALSGALSALPFVFPQLFFLSWIALVPTFYPIFCNQFNAKKVFRLGFVRNFVFYFIVYSWFVNLYPLSFLGMNKFESVLVILTAMTMLPLLHSAELSFAFLLMSRIRKNRLLVTASLFTLVEYVQSLGTFGFSWARLCISQTSFLPSIQSAELFGGYFVSFLIVLINALLAMALSNRKKAKQYVTIAIAIFLLNTIYGTVRLMTIPINQNTIQAGIIQGNIDTKMKWLNNSAEDISRKYVALTAKAIEQAKSNGKPLDLIVFPETAIPVIIDAKNETLTGDDAAVRTLYQELAYQTGIPFLTGAFYRDGEKEYNSVFLIDPSKTVSKPYYKRHLVPFGEYLPYRFIVEKLLPFTAQMNAFGSDLTSGKDSSIFQTDFGKVGSLVCFDSIFDSLSRESVLDGAQLLVIVTNDSWYRDSPAVYQHNSHAVLRAVENRRSVLRAANTGISSVILPTGKVSDFIPPLKSGYLTASVPLENHVTMYTRTGNSIILFCLFFILFGIDFKAFITIIKNKKVQL